MLASVSLWLSGWRGSKSSIHYDSFQNLLVVVAGEKRVLLWSPAEAAGLHPHQLGGESGNHSAVDVAQPDRFPGFGDALRRAAVVTLRAGDALYIPEGFWHQVDSSGGTVAVNYWRVMRAPQSASAGLTYRSPPFIIRWRSEFSDRLGGHMDAYFARRALESLILAEKKRLLRGESGGATSAPKHPRAHEEEDGSAKRARVDPAAPRAWEDGGALSRHEDEVLTRLARGICDLGSDGRERGDDDAVWDLDTLLRDYTPPVVQNVLGRLAASAPHLLHRLLKERLTPQTAEALTVAFEEADRLRGGSAASDGPAGLYARFYAAADGDDAPGTFLARLLRMKEQFAAQATKNVLAAVLGAPASGTDGE